MVKKLKEKGYRLKYLLIAIDLPKSTYYFEINKVDAVKIRNKNIENKISDIFNNHKGRYGVRRVYRELLNQGYTINHKKVQRIMHELKLFGKRPREKYHSYKGKVGKIADNIIDRNFKANKPLQKWSTDVSQFNFSWGKCYISPILDMYTNEIISYDLSLSPNLEQISNMLMKAFNKFPILNNLILHSDQGWQYQHKYYIRELKKHGIIQSMSRKGNCYDNSIMETFFGRLKNEVYYGYEKSYNSFEEFSKAIEKYIYYYNNERIQKKTKWMPPTKYRLASTTTN
ncbi:IS3 family transposase [Finegoldia sp. BIOML-A2]|uniref:IS3 family transposase n=1 Tax=Finegoldia TaxID=150022 RepID=UPI001325D7EF|nr:IS3 family transposase [Finegoldia magna]MSA96481.1 IS3 family transposase [Finegoldia sp. BIOML-A5]MSA99865.1 IS3 family transposase [Finegoldia sp. BIOML-A2]